MEDKIVILTFQGYDGDFGYPDVIVRKNKNFKKNLGKLRKLLKVNEFYLDYRELKEIVNRYFTIIQPEKIEINV